MLLFNCKPKFLWKKLGYILLLFIFVEKATSEVSVHDPLIIQEWSSRRYPVSGTVSDVYFGSSLASTTESFGMGSGRFKLFIGAMNETRATKNSGVVWACNFEWTSGRDYTLSCSILSSISEKYTPPNQSCAREFGRLYYPEKETEQYIGASLSILGSGSLLACAPRTKQNGWKPQYTCNRHTRISGVCYSMSFRTSSVVEVSPAPHDQGYYYVWTDTAHDIGFSSDVASSGEILLGAPSEGRGPGAFYKCVDQSCVRRKRFDVYFGREQPGYGYAIKTGSRRHSSGFVAVGGPKDKNMVGAVKIYDMQSENHMETLVGEQLGSRFGHTLETVDINGDGNDELLVGAPFFSPKTQSEEAPDSGCVYIYEVTNVPAKLISRLCPNEKNTWRVSPRARFGTAIANIGDINADKYNDFAVSAPYDDNGVGTLFIFYGNKNLHISIPSESIRAKLWNMPNLRGLGTALIGGKDVDGNNVPDIVASSFETGCVVILRSKPIVKPHITVSFFTNFGGKRVGPLLNILPTYENLIAKVCVTFTSSTVFTADLVLKTLMEYQIGPDSSKFEFVRKSQNFSRAEEMSYKNGLCVDLRLLQKDTLEKVTNFIEFTTTFIHQSTTNNPVTYKSLTVSYTSQRNQIRYNNFNLLEPSAIPTLKATSRLEIAQDTCSRNSAGKPVCTPDLQLVTSNSYKLLNAKSQAQYNKNTKFKVGELESVFLEISLSNTGQTAYNPTFQVFISLPSSLKPDDSKSLTFNWLTTPGKHGECVSSPLNQTANKIVCMQLLHGNNNASYMLQVSGLDQLYVVEDGFLGNVLLTANVYPEENPNSLYKRSMSPKQFKMHSDLRFSMEQAPKPMESIDWKPEIDIEETLLIHNKGSSKTTGEKVELELLIPTHTKVDSDYIQVVEFVNPSTKSFKCIASGFSFYSKSLLSVNGTEAIKDPALSEAVTQRISNKAWTLSDCENSPDIVCHRVICRGNMPAKGFVSLDMHLKLLPNVTHILETSDVLNVDVEILAQLSFSKKHIQTLSIFATSNFVDASIPFWLYITSMAGGLVILGFITFGLFRCGFFRREVKQKLETLKRQTMMEMDEGMSFQTLLAANR